MISRFSNTREFKSQQRQANTKVYQPKCRFHGIETIPILAQLVQILASVLDRGLPIGVEGEGGRGGGRRGEGG